ncbi:MAG: 4Fe-4S binding protein [Candidatus Heimdallarchaeota archaeon]|nr:MAG: 4Fe-4S binding protein [Candidatus Heimdallarchaeota archaeon]
MPRSRLFVWLLKKGFPLRSIFARITRIPLLGRIMDYMLFHEDEIIYIPKDEASIIKIDQEIHHSETIIPSMVIEHFIKEANYHWIMDWCICRSASSCKEYPIDLGCLFLGEAAIQIDPNLGKRVTKEEALLHVQKCREAGLVHLVGRNKLDTFWLKIGPGNKLLTICNCCPCCCLWRILPHVSKKIAGKVSKMPGVTVSVGEECIGCRTCVDVCFVHAIKVVDERAVIGDSCRGCGRCVMTCPQNAITLTIAGVENLHGSITHIDSLVDVT